MNCPICSNQMIKARATNFGPEYDYCRNCKKELSEMQINPCLEIKLSPRLGSFNFNQLNGGLNVISNSPKFKTGDSIRSKVSGIVYKIINVDFFLNEYKLSGNTVGEINDVDQYHELVVI